MTIFDKISAFDICTLPFIFIIYMYQDKRHKWHRVAINTETTIEFAALFSVWRVCVCLFLFLCLSVCVFLYSFFSLGFFFFFIKSFFFAHFLYARKMMRRRRDMHTYKSLATITIAPKKGKE